MKLTFRAGLAAALYALLLQGAHAQLSGGAGVSAKAVTHTEYDLAGRRLVHESGSLPGLVFNAAYKLDDITWIAAADWYRGAIDYRGQTQNGTAADSTTSTGLASMRVGAAYSVGLDYSILAALELDEWKRNIRTVGGSAGLQETYRSRRLLAGASKAWRPAVGTIATDAAIVLSEPERLTVGFSGMFDPVAFETKRSLGIRIGARIRPAFAPYLELSSRYDWVKIARSDDAPLTLNGQFRGTVAQPEHTRQALTLAVSAVF
ncbi:MAG TPA: hypothetical protein VF861_00660 [Telluria sp.]